MSTPTPLTFNGYVAQIATLAVVQYTTGSPYAFVDAASQALLPQMLNYAELRIQRDLDLFQAAATPATYSLTAASNLLTLGAYDFVAVQTLTAKATTGGTTSTPLTPVSPEFLQNLYPDNTVTGPPKFFAPLGGDNTGGVTSQLYQIGPYTDQAYTVTAYGLQRLPTLYVSSGAGTNATFISTMLPDLLLMASMIFISGFQRNFGRQSDDPQMAVSYESQYKSLLDAARMENYRAKFQASGWTSQAVPTSTPTR